MSDIRWIHISDLHFGDQNYPASHFREDFLEKLSELSRDKRFNFLFITGDIIHAKDSKNHEKECYNNAIEYINKIQKILNISKECICFVPGNHDARRSNERSETIANLKKNYDSVNGTFGDGIYSVQKASRVNELESAFQQYKEFYEKFKEEPCDIWHRVEEHDQINILYLNTALFSNESKTDYGTLIVSIKDLQKALTKLNRSKPTIVLAHHGFSWFNPDEAAHIEEEFKRHNITLYLCGHIHIPQVRKFMNVCHDKWMVECLCPTYYYGEKNAKRGFFEGYISSDRKNVNYTFCNYHEEQQMNNRWSFNDYPVLPEKQINISLTEPNRYTIAASEQSVKTKRPIALAIGSIIKLGAYCQECQDIFADLEWEVIHIQNDLALLLSKQCIDLSRFASNKKAPPKWKKSLIFHFLNDDFFNKAFSDDEKKIINFNSDEKVFILSKEQIDLYLSNKISSATVVAKLRAAKLLKGDTCYWWTSTPCPDSRDIYCMDPKGVCKQVSCTYEFGGIRPAIWLDRLKYTNMADG